MDNASLLASVPIFRTLAHSHLVDTAATARREKYQRADVIIREGSQDARLFVIVSGAVNIYKAWGEKRQRKLRQLDAGSWFGEMALLVDERRTATVVAGTDVELLSLSQSDLAQVIQRYPDLSFELLRTLARRMQGLEEELMTTLGGFLPICAGCKSIREEDGRWTSVEDYFSAHSDVSFSHSLCPACDRKLNPEFYKD